MSDSQNLTRAAQRLVVEYKQAWGNPPSYGGPWLPVWGVKIDRIEINQGSRPSMAALWFPSIKWNDSTGLRWGDMVRIRTDQQNASNRTVLFVGFVTRLDPEFSGGSERPGAGFERLAVIAMDHRWVISACSIIFGQIARSPDDYDSGSVPYPDKYLYLTGRRLIFNPDARPNMDPLELTSALGFPAMPVFCNPGQSDAVAWTARDMVRYLLSPRWRKVNDYLPIDDSSEIEGLEVMADPAEDAKNWGKVLNHIVIDGLNTIEAIELVCRHIGWSFRLDYENDGSVNFVFYKVGLRDSLSREDNPVIYHDLHAPAQGETISSAVSEGRKMLWSMSMAQDIASVVNNPFALGAPHRFEFTAELVPAWYDSFLIIDTEDLSDLFFTDADLQNVTDPNSLLYYYRYHARGYNFGANPAAHNVGRKWVLNETGVYTGGDYDRGEPFDWSLVLPADYIISSVKDDEGNIKKKRMFARYNRRLLPCLTVLQDGLSSVGIKLEFSFDGGVTWQIIPCSVRLLDDECGIFIDEPNIAEIVDKSEGAVSGGALNGIQLNLFTSLADDRVNTNDFATGDPLGHNRVFKDGEWRTRVRITASVQMDLRLMAMGMPSSSSGSPFDQSQLYDWSEKYGLAKRSDSSSFKTGFLNARELDSKDEANAHIDSVRKNNEDMSLSGRFTLDRLWLGDGSGKPDFMIGDSISKITGREYVLELLTFEGGRVSPEICQIVYLPETQRQVLITRDLRYAKVDNL